MSEIAVEVRTARQRWAAPGSPHDRLVAVMRVGLPMAIGVLAAFLVMAPLTSAGDVSFVLDKNKVDLAPERMNSQAARYRGQDNRGQAFELDAGSAIQRSSAEPIVRLSKLSASLQTQDGPARLVAPGGRYDMDSQRMRVTGPVAFTAAGGYRLDTGDAIVDLGERKLESVGAVEGTLPQGVYRADRLQADLDSRTVVLNGNARLRIVPRGAR